MKRKDTVRVDHCSNHVVRANFKGSLFAATKIGQVWILTESSETDECITAQRSDAQHIHRHPFITVLSQFNTVRPDYHIHAPPIGAIGGRNLTERCLNLSALSHAFKLSSPTKQRRHERISEKQRTSKNTNK